MRMSNTRRQTSLPALAIAAALLLASGPAEAAASTAVVRHGARTDPAVALTFDDGWTGAGALRIARVLLAKDAHATFLPYGAAVWQSPAIFDWIAAQPGFEIANHTATHDILCIATTSGCLSSGVSMGREIVGGRLIISGLIGRPLLNVLRPPGGNYNGAVLAAAVAAGYPAITLWDVSAADTAARTSAAVRSNMDKAGNGSIVLAHMGPTTTMAALPDVVDDLRAAGHPLATLSELLSLPAEPAQVAHDYATGGFGPAGGTGPRWQPSEVLDGAGHRYLAWTQPDGVWYATNASGAWLAE